MKYKRYMVFRGIDYNSPGGLEDCFRSYDTLEEAKRYLDSVEHSRDLVDWYHIFDRYEGIKIEGKE